MGTICSNEEKERVNMNNNNIRSSEKNMVSNIGISPTNQNYENFINTKSVEKNDLDINESSRGETKNEIDYYSKNNQRGESDAMES